MKKLMSVFVLLVFVGSLIVMTGCFGGDDGIGAILGIAAIVLVISASGGGAAPVFAANTRDNLRPAISQAATGMYMKVIPLNEDGTDNTAGIYTIAADKITYKDSDKTFNASATIQDAYTQYRVELCAKDLTAPIMKSIVVPTKKVANAEEKATVTPLTTAKTLVFEKWNSGVAKRKHYLDFTAKSTAAAVNFTPVQTAVETDLTTWALPANITKEIVFNTTTAPVNTAVNAVPQIKLPLISGYAFRADGTARDAQVIYLKADSQTVKSTSTNSDGYYLFEGIEAKSYVVEPAAIADHTFVPANYSLTVVAESSYVNQNFQAKAVTAAVTPVTPVQPVCTTK
ncbi:MAG TPA: hypothetical protein PLM07_18175 [Candidatus Rifleibacterium sp.]|nr:hypothetical protein [Candidatus Rifleibacterium sp.]HPT47810.1 hypothetical protein [Candidatus Rifleibacterium sp.]